MRYLTIICIFLSYFSFSQDTVTSYLVDSKGKVSYDSTEPVVFEHMDNLVNIKGKDSSVDVDINIKISKYSHFLGSVDVVTLYNEINDCALIVIIKPYFINNIAIIFIEAFEYYPSSKELKLIIEHKKVTEYSMDEMLSEDFEFGSTFKTKKNKLYYVFYKNDEKTEIEIKNGIWHPPCCR